VNGKALLLLSLTLLAGCGTPLGGPPAQAPGGSTAPGQAEPAAERLRGAYARPGQWTLCGAKQPAAVRTSPANQNEIDAFGADRFFLDGWGRRTADGLELVSIERMHVEGPDCREPIDSFVWIAHGEEPFWAFGITTQGMRFKVAGQRARLYPYAAPANSRDKVVYRGDAYTLTLEHAVCHGAMARARYAWTATLEADGRRWKGCAWQGLQQERQDAVPTL